MKDKIINLIKAGHIELAKELIESQNISLPFRVLLENAKDNSLGVTAVSFKPYETPNNEGHNFEIVVEYNEIQTSIYTDKRLTNGNFKYSHMINEIETFHCYFQALHFILNK